MSLKCNDLLSLDFHSDLLNQSPFVMVRGIHVLLEGYMCRMPNYPG